MIDKESYNRFIEKNFLDPSKRINLEKGDVLISQHQNNARLYYVISGKLHGFLPDSMIENFPAFEVEKGKFVGVYSYFSAEGKSYSEVRAAEESVVSYHDKPLFEHSEEQLLEMFPSILSIIVNELSSRQQFASFMAKKSQEHLLKLMKSEKMITLGQMAAGLAHELNNAVGALSSNLLQIENFVIKCLDDKSLNNSHFFNLGREKGQFLSSAEARDLRKKYEKELNISGNISRKLAKTGIEISEIKKSAGKNPDKLEKIYEEWEAGVTLHDMSISAKHSIHVVQSVKQLGVSQHNWNDNTRVNSTIEEALTIIKSISKTVDLQTNLESNLTIEAIPGELVQVWINLIKNAIESLRSSKTSKPKLTVTSWDEQNKIFVTIEDNGPGIPNSIIEKVFEPSFTTKKDGLSFGLGLGLTIVQRIIDAHKGTINVKSKPGQTLFTVMLPK